MKLLDFSLYLLDSFINAIEITIREKRTKNETIISLTFNYDSRRRFVTSDEMLK